VADQTQDVIDRDPGRSGQSGQVVVMAAGAARETLVALVTAAENLIPHELVVVVVVVVAVAGAAAQEADEIAPVAVLAAHGDSYGGV